MPTLSTDVLPCRRPHRRHIGAQFAKRACPEDTAQSRATVADEKGTASGKGTMTHGTDTSAQGSSAQGSSARGSDGTRLGPSSYCFCGVTPNDVDVRTVPCSSRTNHPCRRPRAAMTASTVNRQTVGEAVTAGPRAVGVAAAVGTAGRPDRCPSGWSRCSSSHSLGR